MTITWEEMVALEPGLGQLLATVSKAKLAKGQCKDDIWYGIWGYKRTLVKLAGNGARVEALRSSQAYDAAYEKLYSSLPKCECCGNTA